MAKLRAATPRLKQPTPRIGYAQGDTKAQDQNRNRFAPWRAWYHTPRWAKLRADVLSAADHTCRMCGRVAPSPDLVADHVEPHHGDPMLFWDRGNIQCLCRWCHSAEKQRQERRG